jgi:alkylation response protein AidB-like acyl-CoA dehydrogenase
MTADAKRVEGPEESRFRLHAKSWLKTHATPRGASEDLVDERELFHPDRLAEGFAFHRALWEAGLAGISVPQEYGGQGLPVHFEKIWDEEVTPYELPPHGSGAALKIAMPMLLAHGSEHLKQFHVPKILRAEVSWCQFLSEPGGGSDLAGVRTRAVRDGDDWLISGSKIWTTGAHFSQYAMCLARTDVNAPKHEGVTMFVVPIPSAGLEVRPIRQINGAAEFNEEFLDSVRVSADCVIGEVNDGWRVAQTMLGFERKMMGDGSMTGGTRAAKPPVDLVELAQAQGFVGNAHARQMVADIWVKNVVAAEATALMLADFRAGKGSPFFGSALKLLANAANYSREQAAMALAGTSGIAWATDDAAGAGWSHSYLNMRSMGLGGGTDEIQKNIIGERIIGLPSEPRVDRDMPFRDIPTSRRS